MSYADAPTDRQVDGKLDVSAPPSRFDSSPEDTHDIRDGLPAINSKAPPARTDSYVPDNQITEDLKSKQANAIRTLELIGKVEPSKADKVQPLAARSTQSAQFGRGIEEIKRLWTTISMPSTFMEPQPAPKKQASRRNRKTQTASQNT